MDELYSEHRHLEAYLKAHGEIPLKSDLAKQGLCLRIDKETSRICLESFVELKVVDDFLCSSTCDGLEKIAIKLGSLSRSKFLAGEQQSLYVYNVRSIRYCDAEHEMGATWDFSRFRVVYPTALHSVLVGYYKPLKRLEVGDGLLLSVRPVDFIDPFYSLKFFKPCFDFWTKDGADIDLNMILKVINKLDAIVSAIGYRPISPHEISLFPSVEDDDLNNVYGRCFLVLPAVFKYGFDDLGPYNDLPRREEIDLGRALDGFLRRNLTPLLYWRACCVAASLDGLFLENILNQLFICIDSLFGQSEHFHSKRLTRSQDVDDFLAAMVDSGVKIKKKMTKFLESSNFRFAYCGKDAFNDKIWNLFQLDDEIASFNFQDKSSEAEMRGRFKNYCKMANHIRNNLAHGRVFDDGLSSADKQLYQYFHKWLYDCTHKAVLRFLSLASGFEIKNKISNYDG